MPVFLGSEGFLKYLKLSEIPQISAEINWCISDINKILHIKLTISMIIIVMNNVYFGTI